MQETSVMLLVIYLVIYLVVEDQMEGLMFIEVLTLDLIWKYHLNNQLKEQKIK